jgi:ABC-type branched-subunit amino acid transport system ATPase component
MLLQLKDVNVAYGPAKVLHDISFQLLSGEQVFMVGRNGAGKTTLLKTIAGFLTPFKGSILYEGKEITGMAPEKISSLGIRYIFQDKRVFTKLTVKENLEIAAYPTREKLSDAIERVVSLYPKIKGFLNMKAGSLSGGQRQILLIGRALIGDPRILLIDEPTEGLAAGIISDIFQLLCAMKGKTSMLIVEQNIPVVMRLADRICIMKEGNLFKEIKERSEMASAEMLEKYL